MRRRLAADEPVDADLLEHLLVCETCRSSWVAAGAPDQTDPPSKSASVPEPTTAAPAPAVEQPRPRSRGYVGWAVAATATVGVVLTGIGVVRLIGEGRFESEPATASAVLRGAEETTLTPVGPRGEVATFDALRFEWTDRTVTAEPVVAPRYRLIIADLEQGATLIETDVQETFYVLTDAEAARLEHGPSYHWIVEALDGTTAEPSPAVPFRSAR